MRTYNTYYDDIAGFSAFLEAHAITDNQNLLIQIFTSLCDSSKIIAMRDSIHKLLPSALLIGATTDGEICQGTVTTDRTVVSLTQFKTTALQSALVNSTGDCYETGRRIADALVTPETNLLITFTDGIICNGENYLKGITSRKNDLVIAGGMAGDRARFRRTYVFTHDAISDDGAVGVALYNPHLHIRIEHNFNWIPVGKQMTVTKVEHNRIYTIDNISAYEIYRYYLGEEVAQQLPAIGIEFPLIIERHGRKVARAVLKKHEDGSLSFSGNFEKGDSVYFGYGEAEMILESSKSRCRVSADTPAESIFIYSCMARRRFMPNLIGSEIRPFAALAPTAGFFTYGEFFTFDHGSELLNQTMTILILSESSQQISCNTLSEETAPAALNEYQKSIKALSHLLNITTKEMMEEYNRLQQDHKLIQAKKESLRLAQEIGHFGSWEIDLATKKAQWSKESYHIYRLDPKTTEPTLDTFMSMVIPEDRPKVTQVLTEGLDGKIKTLEVEAVRHDGEHIHLLLNGKILFDKQGNPATLIGTTLDITEQVKLRTYNEELASIIEDSSNEIYIIEQETYRYLYVNRSALNRLGYSKEEMLQMNVLDINKEITREQIEALEAAVIANGSIMNRTVHTCKDGSTYPVQSYIQYHTYQNKKVGIIFDIDISDLIEAEKRQKEQAQILEQIQDSVISTDMDDIITHWNRGATLIHGYHADEMIGKSIQKLYLPEDAEKLQWMKQQALLHGACQDEIRKITKSGEIIHTHVSLSVLRDEQNRIIGLTRYSQDITHKKKIEQQLKEQTELLNFQAYHDALTHLPNRILFEDRLQQSLANAEKHCEKLGLLFIDLDNFKQINDTLGHHYGDEVLKIVAKRLSNCIREEDTLARLGGDEFTVLIQDLQRSSAVSRVAQQIIDALKPPIRLKNHELHITASIGISLYPKDALNRSDLLKYADTAMYKAKEEGRNNFQFYSEEMTRLAFEKAMMEISLRKAVERKEFVVYYQLQVDARDEHIVGLEALVRWKHPEMGLILPETFIHIAEESDFIKQLDLFVMKQAMQDVKEWYSQGLNPGMLSVNLSIKQLMGKGFIEKLRNVIRQTRFDVRWLKLEITESQMMHDPMKSIDILHQISDMGIQIAIDDFGTGYSSLTYLKRLPVQTLKIDRSFIKDLPDDEEDRAISQAIIALAKSLNLSIIAEGAETKEQVRFLLENGCFYIQGYYFSHPVDKEHITTYIQTHPALFTP